MWYYLISHIKLIETKIITLKQQIDNKLIIIIIIVYFKKIKLNKDKLI